MNELQVNSIVIDTIEQIQNTVNCMITIDYLSNNSIHINVIKNE